MPRLLRAFAIGVPYHLTQRGNHGQDVFFTPEDRAIYLRWLAEYRDRYQVSIWAYCLMTNHLHAVATPEQDGALSRTMQMVNGRYTQRQNFLHDWHGHLWQGRFFACALDEEYFWNAIRYVERNPVRAGLVERAEEYRWSSAAAHCGLHTDPLLAPLPAENAISTEGWSGWLDGEDGDDLLLLRSTTARGHPCGSLDFIERLTAEVGRSLHTKLRGRPRKTASQE